MQKTNGTALSVLIVAPPGRLRDGLLAIVRAILHTENVAQAADGPSALAAVTEHTPDLVFLDADLPDNMAGTVLQHLKATSAGSRCIVLTSNDQHDQATSLAGAEVVLLKGFSGADLARTLAELLAVKDQPITASTPPPLPESQTGLQRPARYVEKKHRVADEMKKILVVDDSTTMRRMVLAALRDLEGVSFDQAGSGLEAIERLALAPIHLMILDLNMPDIHGLEVLHFVRQHAAYRTLPVIVLTTRGDDSSRTAALAAGASLYLTKPYQPDALAGQVRQLLENR